MRGQPGHRELGRAGQGETLEQLRGLAAFVMMTDPARGRAFLDRLDRLAAAAPAPGTAADKEQR